MKCLMDHIVLNVEDDETMISFYSEVLLLPTERLEEYRSGEVPFASLRLNADAIIDLFPKSLWRNNDIQRTGRVNLNHFCITVAKPDWDALAERLNTRNIPIEKGPVKLWGAQGMGTSIYFRDPENNLIEVRYYEVDASQRGRIS